MRSFVIIGGLLALFMSPLGLGINPVSSREARDDDCSGPVYKWSEVTRRARIIDMPSPEFTEEARAKNVRGRVVVTAVLCRTGRVTNIEVVESLPHGLTESTVEATRRIKFEPAEKDGQTVSQRIKREYNFNTY